MPHKTIKFYFAHQSVGNNIIEGLQQKSISILNNLDTNHFPEQFIVHSLIGKNLDPFSKIQDFAQQIAIIAEHINLAMLKFCYIDFNKDSDIEKIFSQYQNQISQLQGQFPHITFLHCTVPYTTIPYGLRSLLKKYLGQPIKSQDDNIIRNQYNHLIKNQYEGKEPIFDLARIESTKTDGARQTFKLKGKEYYYLWPEYSSDMGHLNEKGKINAAKSLLEFLS